MTDQRPNQSPIHDPSAETVPTPVPTTPVSPTGSAGAPAAAAVPPEVAVVDSVTPTGQTGVPTAATVGASSPRTSRTRWALALGLIALIVIGTAAVTLALTGASPSATVLGYVPSGSVAYGEVRLDLPGDQRREVGEFLAKFPGFADQAALDTKLDEVLDRLVSEGTDGEQTFTRDIKPWFDGEVAFAMGPLPEASSADDPMTAAADARALALISIKDEALARAWFSDAMGEAGVAGETETHGGVDVTVFRPKQGSDVAGAFALVGGKVAIAGDLTSVKAAIDTGGDGEFARDPRYTAAAAAMDDDHVGFMFMDLRTLMDGIADLARSTGGANEMPFSDAVLGLVPDWVSMRLRVEGDALLMDSAMPHVEAAPGPDQNRANGVAGYAPPSTIVLAAGNDYGEMLVETIDFYRDDPNLKDVFAQIDQVAGVLGGLGTAVSWMGDAGLVVARADDAIEGGLVVIPADADKGRQLLTTLRSFVTLGGGQAGVTVRDEDYGGATITIIDLGDARSLLGMAGAMGGVPVPDDASGLPAGRIEIAYAATDGVVVLGSGPDFVRSVLDAGSGDSLADDSRYTGLVGRVGAEHTGVTFVDLAAIRALVEGKLAEASAEERAEYEESVKPFLDPFDALVGAGVTGTDLEQQHLIVTVK